jgi:D-tyrosyl-tRNA(Tyr) deacylase
MVGSETVGRIGAGLCVLLGVGKYDSEKHAAALADKIRQLRVFDDETGKMNRAVGECGGEILVISQFTLYGDCRKGNRPSFTEAASAETADRLYGYFTEQLRAAGLNVSTGRFQARMRLSLVNDGPVTLIMEN